ncbi:MAG: YciI family protein [Saprospiraceae bacterium]|nr:YciI family protein [Saprospiraceae bacterium]
MKYLFFLFLVFGIACAAPTEDESSATDTTGFDAALAEKLGADDYGMRQYVMALLKAGPNRDGSEEERAALQAAHMENIGKLAEAGKLILAGPFLDDGELRGIYVFDVKTVEEAEALTNTDPAIQAGSLVMELKPWYGSAAMMQINEVHNNISKENP